MPTSRIPEAQSGLIDALSARHPGLRFDTGFISQVPTTADGRYGKRYFHFRYRYDTATLRLGKQDNRSSRRELHRARRTLRRTTGEPPLDDLGAWIRVYDARNTLRRCGRNVLDRYPVRTSAVAGIGNVTGEEYRGDLPAEKAAAVFEQLLGNLQPVRHAAMASQPRLTRGIISGSRTPAMQPHRIVITKHSRRKKR